MLVTCIIFFNSCNIKELCDNPIYECVTPLRCLLIKRVCPNNWNVMQKMEKHTEVRTHFFKYFILFFRNVYSFNFDNLLQKMFLGAQNGPILQRKSNKFSEISSKASFQRRRIHRCRFMDLKQLKQPVIFRIYVPVRGFRLIYDKKVGFEI